MLEYSESPVSSRTGLDVLQQMQPKQHFLPADTADLFHVFYPFCCCPPLFWWSLNAWSQKGNERGTGQEYGKQRKQLLQWLKVDRLFSFSTKLCVHCSAYHLTKPPFLLLLRTGKRLRRRTQKYAGRAWFLVMSHKVAFLSSKGSPLSYYISLPH